MTITKAKEPEMRFKEGDKVKEKPKATDYCVRSSAPDSLKDQIFKISTGQRVGTVVKTYIIKNKRGARRVYVDVLWDGSSRPASHEQTRLTLLDESSPTD